MRHEQAIHAIDMPTDAAVKSLPNDRQTAPLMTSLSIVGGELTEAVSRLLTSAVHPRATRWALALF